MNDPQLLPERGSGAALDLGGRRLNHGELRALVRSIAVGPGPVRAPLDDPVALLATVYAARRAGVPVVVADADAPDELPPGTDLVVATSGSAGRPRLLARTARSWSDSFAAFSALSGTGPHEVVAVTGPLTSTLQLFAAVHALAAGAEVTDRPERATVVHGVPTALATVPRGRALRLVVVAGSEVPARLLDSLPGVAVLEYYGATELSIVASAATPAPLQAFPSVEVDIRDGVLWARSPYLGLGYVGGSDGPYRRTADGFGTVGDRAEGTAAGLRILGRGDLRVTVGGATVQVEDVERVLMTAPGVRAVVVVGVDHPRFGRILAAVVETDDLDAVRALGRSHLSGAARPRYWSAVSRLPRTAAGKIDRGRLADRLRDQPLDLS